ncbi:MAG: hypothetical protein P8100_13290 [bacterium]
MHKFTTSPYPGWHTFLLIILGSCQCAFGQQTDSTERLDFHRMTDQIEFLSQTMTDETDFSDLVEQYRYYHEHPVNLNGHNIDVLLQLYLINNRQLNALQEYLKKYDHVYTLFELKHIDGFDEVTLQRLSPYVQAGPVEKQKTFSPGQLLKQGKHLLITRFGKILETAEGYRADKLYGATYLGNNFSYYLRYGARFGDKIRFGFTLDRDAGELITKKQLSDSIRQIVGGKARNYADFLSGYVFISHIGPVEKLIMGDYHLQFGQGLSMWSGMAFGKSSEVNQVRRIGAGIKPNTATNENRFLRGGAIQLRWKSLSMLAFYSANRMDASLKTSEGRQKVSGLPESGKHRTISELNARDALGVRVTGTRLEYRHDKFRLGSTLFQTRFSLPIDKGNEPYKLYDFRGNFLINLGFDWDVSVPKLSFYGEITGSLPDGLAGLTGLDIFPADRLMLSIHYRNYRNGYHQFFANPFSSGSNISGETGLYLGIRILLAKHLQLSSYIDHYRLTWLRYQKDSPSIGREILLQLDIKIRSLESLYLRYRFRESQQNSRDEWDLLDHLEYRSRDEIRLHLSYRVFDFLRFINRIEFVRVRNEINEPETGFLIYQDIRFRHDPFPLEFSARIGWFDTESFDSRLYAYEHDLRYAFSVPALSDAGIRYYVILQYRWKRSLNLGVRWARTVFLNRQHIGSGNDLIESNKKTELKVQMIIKW